MTRLSILALGTALALCLPIAANAQTAAGTVNNATQAAGDAATTVTSGSTSGGATTDPNASTNAGSTTDANSGGASTTTTGGAAVDASAGANATTPAGSVSAGGSTTTNATTNATTTTATGTNGNGATGTAGTPGAIVTADANGDGTVSIEERTAAATAAGVDLAAACDDSGVAHLMGDGTADEMAFAAATRVVVVPVSDCDAEDVKAALASDSAQKVRDAISANAALMTEVQAQGASAGNVVGGMVRGDTLTVYVTSNS